MRDTEVILKSERPLAVYSDFRKQLEQLRSENAAVVFDYSDPQGNKEARSHIYKLRKTKGAVEKARKEEKAESLKYGRLVDSEAKELVSDIEEMIEIHDKPLREIEEREAERVQKHRDKIEDMRNQASQTEYADGTPMPSGEYKQRIEYLEGIKIDESWQDYVIEADTARSECLTLLRRRFNERVQYEEEQAELARLRKEAEEREAREAAEAVEKARKEHDEQIRREGEERARKAAEEKAAAEKEKSERERKEAAAKAEAERKAAENRELELKLAAETAEREKAEAEQRAAQAERDAVEKAQREAKEKVDAEYKSALKREANKTHRAKYNNEALAALVDGGIDNAIARACITLIAEGKIPHIKISY